LPLVGWINVVSSLITVDFPAPFGPKKPKICPSFTSRSIPSTAFIPSYDLDRLRTKIDFMFDEILDILISAKKKKLKGATCQSLKNY